MYPFPMKQELFRKLNFPEGGLEALTHMNNCLGYNHDVIVASYKWQKFCRGNVGSEAIPWIYTYGI